MAFRSDFRVLITGSRTWEPKFKFYALTEMLIDLRDMFGNDLLIVHGACPDGADNIAQNDAEIMSIRTERHPADWHTLGKRAGFVRNDAMVKLGASVCLAFIHNESRGATMCADLADKAGIYVKRFETND